MRRPHNTHRGVSPVVGVALLIAIVLVFSAVAGYVFLAFTDTTDPAPQVVWESDSSDDFAEWELVHEGGERVDGDRLELQGTATPDAAAGTNLTTNDAVPFYPTESEVEVVWYGEDDSSHLLTTIEVERPLPVPDEDCDWVDSESNGGNDVTVDGITVNCDVEITGNVNVRNDGAVVGTVRSDDKELDLDDAAVYGDVEVEEVANLQNGTVTGSVTSITKQVKLDDTTVGGAIEAGDTVEVMSDSQVNGSVESTGGAVKVHDSATEGDVQGDDRVDVVRSYVEGDAYADDVDLDRATVEGHVYVDPADFDCKDSTINGQDCGSYTPRDPADW